MGIDILIKCASVKMTLKFHILWAIYSGSLRAADQLHRLHQTGLGAYLVWKDRHQIAVALGIFLQLMLAIYTQTVINPESPLSCGVGLKWFCLVAITLFSPHKLHGNNEIPDATQKIL